MQKILIKGALLKEKWGEEMVIWLNVSENVSRYKKLRTINHGRIAIEHKIRVGLKEFPCHLDLKIFISDRNKSRDRIEISACNLIVGMTRETKHTPC